MLQEGEEGFALRNLSSQRARAFAVAVVLFGTVWLGSSVKTYWEEKIIERRMRRESAIAEAREYFLTFRPPPKFNPIEYSKSVEIERKNKYSAFEIEQRFELQGRFKDVVAEYIEELSDKGWAVFNPSEISQFYIELCRAPWLLTLQQDADFEAERPPHHRLALKLTWIDGFGPDRCPVSQALVSR